MSASGDDACRSIREAMVGFLGKHPEGTLADWARTSAWSRDTGGMRDRTGAPTRAQGGKWRSLFHKAQDELAAQPVDSRTVISGALQGRGLPILWWLALVLVPGAPCRVSLRLSLTAHTSPRECVPQGIDSSGLTLVLLCMAFAACSVLWTRVAHTLVHALLAVIIMCVWS
jgi:hypothetical protein